MISYLEDLVDFIAKNNPHGVQPHDLKLFHSIDRQLKKNIAITKKQQKLIERKIDLYSDSFNELGIENAALIVYKTKQPIRQVDNTRLISLIDEPPSEIPSVLSSLPLISVKFRFKKGILDAINDIRKYTSTYYKDKNTLIHYFPYNEKNLFYIVKRLSGMNFELDPRIQEYYNIITTFNKQSCCSGIINYQFQNISEVACNMLNEELGDINEQSLLLYKDRSILYGIDFFDDESLQQTKKYYSNLATKIATRNSSFIKISPLVYTTRELISSLYELKRFPLLIILPKHECYERLTMYYDLLCNYIDPCEIKTAFKMSFDSNSDIINNFIKQYSLMTTITNNTKVVFIIDSKFPKNLISLGWKAKTLLMLGTTKVTSLLNILDYYKEIDLKISYEYTMTKRIYDYGVRNFNKVSVI